MKTYTVSVEISFEIDAPSRDIAKTRAQRVADTLHPKPSDAQGQRPIWWPADIHTTDPSIWED